MPQNVSLRRRICRLRFWRRFRGSPDSKGGDAQHTRASGVFNPAIIQGTEAVSVPAPDTPERYGIFQMKRAFPDDPGFQHIDPAGLQQQPTR